MRTSTRKYAIASALALGAAGALAMGLMVSSAAHAQWTVFDPSNYFQNLLTATRTLQQVNNQMRMLQNQARGLVDQEKNLATIDFPEVERLRDTLTRIDHLMAQAKGIQFRIATLDQQYRALYPARIDPTASNDDQLVQARARFNTTVAAYKQTMTVQAQVVENIAADEPVLQAIVARSQDAEGALQAAQATNQLLALVVRQQFQIQALMAAQYRADALARATTAEARRSAHAASISFLGSGKAYTPQ